MLGCESRMSCISDHVTLSHLFCDLSQVEPIVVILGPL